ncbi:hypothetical protein O0880_12675 [Janthinobacterium sp. SUN118]|uniref:hypothetical protein n=1 Tax=Janthinobacterium sp. SUN118 TaxID=3004100 RepID=UPI0025B020FE|nr:hypothetical protein [Janthinobacterium sp. SUN118]MDN2710276.1 hypothetical protein [Janthinobacterium sp. SUN118]
MQKEQEFPSHQIDAEIAQLGDWRGAMLARACALLWAAVALNTAPKTKRTST